MSGIEPGTAARGDPVEFLLRRLRAGGFSITAEDYARVRRVHVLRSTWRRGELRHVLRACVVRSSDSGPTFNQAFTEAFADGPDDEQVFPEKPPDAVPPPDDPPAVDIVNPKPAVQNPDSGPLVGKSSSQPRFRGWTGRGNAWLTAWVAWLQLRQQYLQSGVVLAGGIAGAVALVRLGPAHLKMPANPWSDEIDLSAVVLGGLGALLLTAAVAAVADTWMKLRAEQAEARKERLRSPPASPRVHSDAQFRVGLIGAGPPPAALQPRRGRQIAELLTYVDAGPDPSRYDVAASIRRCAIHPDETGLVPARRRVLPEVVFLCDVACQGPRWNTLAREASELFRQRGLAVDVIEVDGSFHRGRRGGAPARAPAIHALLADLEDAPPRLLLLFTDGARMTMADLDVLRRLRKAGPVLWLDYRDRWLWDVRHAAIAATGIGVWQTTEEDLESGLRTVFAPSAQSKAFRPWREPEGRPLTLRRQALRILGDAADWAADCALVQPISLALADRIRRHLHPHQAWQAFSRLLALPGSSLAAEGLRFGAPMTAFLRQRFALRRPPDTQARVTSLLLQAIEDARPDAPGSSYAEAAWDWTRLQVKLYAQPDDALPEIARLRDRRLIDPAPIDDLLDRTRRGAGLDERMPQVLGDEIVLPAPPVSLAARRILRPEDSAGPRVIWQIGAMLLRDELSPKVGAHEIAFTGAGEVFASILRVDRAPDVMLRSHITSGLTFTVGETESRGPLLALAGARRTVCLVALSLRGELLVNGAGTPPDREAISFFALPGFKVSGPPSTDIRLAVSPDGLWAAVSTGSMLALCNLRDSAERAPLRLGGDVTALAAAGTNEAFLAGFADGSLALLDVGMTEEAEPTRLDLSLPGAVTALGVAPPRSAGAGQRAIVAAGQAVYVVLLPGGTLERTIHLGWTPTRVEAFADGVTAAVAGAGRLDILDLDLGVSAFEPPAAPDGEPLPLSLDVCAISPEGRRFAVSDTDGSVPRVEVHGLRKRLVQTRSAPAPSRPA